MRWQFKKRGIFFGLFYGVGLKGAFFVFVLKRAYFSVLFLYFFDASLIWQFKMRGTCFFVFVLCGEMAWRSGPYLFVLP